jgi:hypothetical protein
LTRRYGLFDQIEDRIEALIHAENVDIVDEEQACGAYPLDLSYLIPGQISGFISFHFFSKRGLSFYLTCHVMILLGIAGFLT